MLAGCGKGGVGPIKPIPTSTVTARTGKPVAIYAQPTGGKTPRALLMLIHGGSWSGINPTALRTTEAIARIFQVFGFETVTVDYRAGAQGIADVEHFYREARKRVGPNLPICAYGVSAGGHIALMLAEKFPDLACVVDQSGPTDLTTLKSQGSAAGYAIAVRVFGRHALAKYSPALHASSIKAKLMLAYADNDPLVPVAQGEEMKRAVPSAELFTLPPGPAPFTHTGVGAPAAKTGVSASAKQAWQTAAFRFLMSST